MSGDGGGADSLALPGGGAGNYGFPTAHDRQALTSITQDLQQHSTYMRQMAATFDQMIYALRIIMSGRNR